MKAIELIWLLIFSLFVSCVNDNKSSVVATAGSPTNDSFFNKIDSQVLDSNHDSVINKESLKPHVDVSAYLIYNDGTLSSFDVLNNDTVMLWNAVAGGGDVLKPSHSTKFIVAGKIDSLDIKVKVGDELRFEKELRDTGNKFEFVVKGTGCALVSLNITKTNRLILNDTIDFHCGE